MTKSGGRICPPTPPPWELGLSQIQYPPSISTLGKGHFLIHAFKSNAKSSFHFGVEPFPNSWCECDLCVGDARSRFLVPYLIPVRAPHWMCFMITWKCASVLQCISAPAFIIGIKVQHINAKKKSGSSYKTLDRWAPKNAVLLYSEPLYFNALSFLNQRSHPRSCFFILFVS